MTVLPVMPLASATAEMSRQGSPVKERTLLFPSSVLLCHLYFLSLTSFLFAFFRPLSQSRRILFYLIEGSLPTSFPVLFLLLCHSFCITFQFLQAFPGFCSSLKSWLTGSVCHVKSLFIIYLRKRTLRTAIEQKNAVTCLHLAKSKVKPDNQWWLYNARHMDF